MISTALALQEAVKNAVHDEFIMAMATDLFQSRNEDKDTFGQKLYQYSGALSAMTTTLVTNALLTESQISDLLGTIKEMTEMGDNITNGNN